MNIPSPTIRALGEKRWEVKEAYLLTVAGYVFWCMQGFIFDGGSIPRLFWRSFGHPLQAKGLPAFLIHDGLYRTHLLSRKEADKILRQMLRINGVGAFKAWAIYRGVRIGGWKAYNSYSEEEQLKARELFTIEERKGKDDG